MESGRNARNAMELVALSDKLARKLIQSLILSRECEGLGVQRTLIKEEFDLPAGLSDG